MNSEGQKKSYRKSIEDIKNFSKEANRKKLFPFCEKDIINPTSIFLPNQPDMIENYIGNIID